MKHIGIDIGKRSCAICVIDDGGDILEEITCENSTDELKRFGERITRKHKECRAVCESTGNMWLKACNTLEECGIPVKLANPLKTKAIAEASIKTDKVDARTLAHLLRTNLISECYIGTRDMRDNKQILRNRTSLIHDRTGVINRTHSLLDKYDIMPLATQMYGAKGLEKIEQIKLRKKDQTVLDQYIRHIRYLNDEIKRTEQNIADISSQNESVPLLLSMTGIDYYAAMTLATEIGDVTRFASPKKLISWAGMCPTIHQSGDISYHGRMKKDSNRKANWIMTQVANVASRHDPRMKAFYTRVRSRHNHNIAVSHVANKMLKIIWHMLIHNTRYEGCNEELYHRKLKKIGLEVKM